MMDAISRQGAVLMRLRKARLPEVDRRICRPCRVGPHQPQMLSESHKLQQVFNATEMAKKAQALIPI